MAAVGAVAGVSAHRRDEYLQAARLAIAPGAVDLQLDLTPGIALADTIIADVDRDRDGSLSQDEQRGYGTSVMSALTIQLDGTVVPAQLATASFPEIDAIRRGEAAIRIRSTVTLGTVSAGAHQLLFRNRHHPDRSVYLANALVPETNQVSVTAQRRDPEQTELTIEYVLRGDPPRRTAAAWLLGAIAAGTVLSFALRRPLQFRR